jgi:hypothetical protein
MKFSIKYARAKAKAELEWEKARIEADARWPKPAIRFIQDFGTGELKTTKQTKEQP